MEKEKSENWDKAENTVQHLLPGQLIEGFPFSEGWPKNLWGNFEIILRNGDRFSARVDTSSQYRAEGLQWRDAGGNGWHEHVVAAWREV